MNKKIYYIILILIILLGLVTVYQVYEYVSNRPNIDSVTKRGVIATTKKIDFVTNGHTIRMNDFYQFPVRKVDENALYISDQLEYGVMYWPNEDKFRLPVMAEPVKENSLKAEAELLKLLDISKDDACTLNAVITGHYSVDPAFENNSEYNLSFCPGNHL